MKKNVFISSVIIVNLLVSPAVLWAKDFVLTPQNSTMTGFVKYATLGRYSAAFKKYQGTLDYDAKAGTVKSVVLKIDAATIQSSCAMCDRAVRSSRLLNVKKFSNIIFQSQKITKEKNVFVVYGNLSLHGVTRLMKFPFTIKQRTVKKSKVLNIKGTWAIDRRNFGISWNKTLDRGGFVVGNDVTVQWEVNIAPSK